MRGRPLPFGDLAINDSVLVPFTITLRPADELRTPRDIHRPGILPQRLRFVFTKLTLVATIGTLPADLLSPITGRSSECRM